MARISEADLFFADLMGLSPSTRARARSPADAAAEAFFAELVGEQLIETSIPDDFGEQQRQPTPNVSTTIAAFGNRCRAFSNPPDTRP